jgi:hypothetical protein
MVQSGQDVNFRGRVRMHPAKIPHAPRSLREPQARKDRQIDPFFSIRRERSLMRPMREVPDLSARFARGRQNTLKGMPIT